MAKKLRVADIIVVFNNKNFEGFSPKEFEETFDLQGATEKINKALQKMFPNPKWYQEPKS